MFKELNLKSSDASFIGYTKGEGKWSNICGDTNSTAYIIVYNAGRKPQIFYHDITAHVSSFWCQWG